MRVNGHRPKPSTNGSGAAGTCLPGVLSCDQGSMGVGAIIVVALKHWEKTLTEEALDATAVCIFQA